MTRFRPVAEQGVVTVGVVGDVVARVGTDVAGVVGAGDTIVAGRRRSRVAGVRRLVAGLGAVTEQTVVADRRRPRLAGAGPDASRRLTRGLGLGVLALGERTMNARLDTLVCRRTSSGDRRSNQPVPSPHDTRPAESNFLSVCLER